jgi:Haemolysin-III related
MTHNFSHQTSMLDFIPQKLRQLRETSSFIRKSIQKPSESLNDETILTQKVIDGMFPSTPRCKSHPSIINNALGPLFVNVVAASLNMGFSAYYHNCHCISKVARDLYLKFDLAGIAIMIGGSATPVLYYAFMCKEYTF